jgi:chromosome segregation ATPase
MSKSVEAKLTEAEAEKVALENKVAKLAGENDTYTARMKEMEDAIVKAMERMKAMEEKMEEYAKMKATIDTKMDETKAELETMKEEEVKTEAENTIEGVNEKVIAGVKEDKQGEMPSFIKDKIEESKEKEKEAEEDEEDEDDEEEKEPVAKGKKAKKARKCAEDVVPAPVATAPSVDINALVEAKVAEMTSKFAKTDSKFNELDAELAKAKETLALEAKVKSEAMATVKSLTEKYEALLSKVSGIEASSKTVEEKVAKQVASLGVEPVASTTLEQEVVAKTPQDILKEWEGIRDPKMARQFYLRHSAEIAEATFPKRK